MQVASICAWDLIEITHALYPIDHAKINPSLASSFTVVVLKNMRYVNFRVDHMAIYTIYICMRGQPRTTDLLHYEVAAPVDNLFH